MKLRYLPSAFAIALLVSVLCPPIDLSVGGAASAAQISQKNVVVTVDRNENIYLNNVPIDGAALTKAFAAAGLHRLYVRGDRLVRFQAIAKVIVSAAHAGIIKFVLDHNLNPEIFAKNVPVMGDSMQTLPVAMKDISKGSGLGTSGSDTLIEVDFDGTLLLNREALDQSKIAQALQQLANKNPNAKIYISPNRLSQYGPVVQLIASAQRHGLKNITVICDLR